jgi:hypothetical protein
LPGDEPEAPESFSLFHYWDFWKGVEDSDEDADSFAVWKNGGTQTGLAVDKAFAEIGASNGFDFNNVFR